MFPTVSTFLRTSFFTLLKLLMIIEPPDDRRWTSSSARFYQHCAIKYNNLHGGTYSSRTYFQHISYTLYKTFLGPFWGSQGLLPTIFEFRTSRCVSLYFFRRFDLFFSLPSSRYWTSWWLLNLLMIGGQSPGLLDFTNIAQWNIPISTAAPTHHVSIFNIHLL